MQALSVQSFHNDSPPFTGATDRPLENVPPFDLDESRHAPDFSRAYNGGSTAQTSSSSSSGIISPVPHAEATPRSTLMNQPLPAMTAAIPHTEAHARTSRPGTPNYFHSASSASWSARTTGSAASVPPSPSPHQPLTPGANGKDVGPMGPMSAYTDLDRPSRIASPIDLDHEAENYTFPKHRLATRMQGWSASPPLDQRMFEMAKDSIDAEEKYEILGGYYSPVSDRYKKAGLAPAIHRVRMCELAVDQTSSWLMVDPWEASQEEYQRTAIVLEHFDEHLNGAGGIQLQGGQTFHCLAVYDGKLISCIGSLGSKKKIKIVLLAGGDLIESFGEPGVWSEADLHIILGKFGCLIIERTGSDVWAFLLSHDILYKHRKNVIVVKQLIYNDISSTKVRLFVKRSMSIK
ncbi:hypothetical protein FRB99_006037 [Tulasnella sp. 403]|nr:hypothetical protein FRB99_006037 [Tulasnella sp. 403]